MTEEEVLIRVIDSLNRLKIPYTLTGALAVSFYGYPRSTHDFDMVVQIQNTAGLVKKLLKAFEKDFYISEEGIIDAVMHHTMFNLIHHETGQKIDLWILKNDEYSQCSFKRRIKNKILDMDIYILSPEDLILSKLEWYKISQSEKHIKDIKGIIELQREKLDINYINKWASKLSIHGIIKELFQ